MKRETHSSQPSYNCYDIQFKPLNLSKDKFTRPASSNESFISLELPTSNEIKENNFSQKLKKVHERRSKTPNQKGRRSPLQKTIPIETDFDECDLEIMKILSNPNDIVSTDENSENDYYHEIYQEYDRQFHNKLSNHFETIFENDKDCLAVNFFE